MQQEHRNDIINEKKNAELRTTHVDFMVWRIRNHKYRSNIIIYVENISNTSISIVRKNKYLDNKI